MTAGTKSAFYRPRTLGTISPGVKAGARFCPVRFRSYAQDLSHAIFELSREYQMGIKLQGIAAKFAKLEHDAEFEAEKLDARVEEVAARLPNAFSGAHKAVDGLDQRIGDVEGLVAGVEAIGNGAPKEKPPETASLPIINLVPLAS